MSESVKVATAVVPVVCVGQAVMEFAVPDKVESATVTVAVPLAATVPVLVSSTVTVTLSGLSLLVAAA